MTAFTPERSTCGTSLPSRSETARSLGGADHVETRLAEEYQVSRGTVRRALEQLKKAELIETRMDRAAMWRSTAGDMSGPDG